MPEGAQERLAAQWINAANSVLGGISFPPHVTLMGSLPAGPLGVAPFVAMGAALAAGIPASEVRLTELSRGETHFRRLAVEVEKNAVLAQAREAAEALFTNPTASPFKPHLSLFYGDSLPGELPGAIGAIQGELPRNLMLDRLVLARTIGPVTHWVLHRSWALPAHL
jgi:hypothetical protein